MGETEKLNNFKISNDGINFIKSWEKLVKNLYNDAVNLLTIGYGHCIKDGELSHDKSSLTIAGKNYSVAEFTESDANEILKDDLAIFEDGVNKCVLVKLEQNQFDALVSFSFNLGLENLERSTLLKIVNGISTACGITDAFDMWNEAGGKALPGLTKRRLAEANIYLTGKYLPPSIEKLNNFRISNDGINFIKSWEKLVKNLYNDAVNLLTIGYGHCIKDGELSHDKSSLTIAGKNYSVAEFTESDANEILKDDLAIFEDGVNKCVLVKLEQNQFDALVSFSFNLGLENLERSTLLKIVNGISTACGITDAFDMWNEAGGKALPGLTKRRLAEANIYLTGKYLPPSIEKLNNFRISNDGINFIKSWEKLVKNLYNDAVNLPTIGYGHCIKDGELSHDKSSLTIAGKNYSVAGFTEADANEILKDDLAIFEDGVNKCVLVKLEQNQFDALVSFSFNLGLENLERSTLLKIVNGISTACGITDAFDMWNEAGGKALPGLTKRRLAEANIYLTGKYLPPSSENGSAL